MSRHLSNDHTKSVNAHRLTRLQTFVLVVGAWENTNMLLTTVSGLSVTPAPPSLTTGCAPNLDTGVAWLRAPEE